MVSTCDGLRLQNILEMVLMGGSTVLDSLVKIHLQKLKVLYLIVSATCIEQVLSNSVIFAACRC